ncbi:MULTISPECIES: hypothetical protein [Micrococcales]|uniref:Uncharacterized protein n=1 Tax=Pseudarthrobacter oxydans TaxID=1671 RepID=A0AAW8NE89_PSEOX|nr:MULTISPECIES: hypothetical protein [Micrococcales]MDR7165642.1 hypothetical protein [Pseudarthrobacter oxydans]
MRTINPHRTTADARTRADLTHAESDELCNLPVADAARRIEAKRNQQERTRRQAARRARQLDPFDRGSRRTGQYAALGCPF